MCIISLLVVYLNSEVYRLRSIVENKPLNSLQDKLIAYSGKYILYIGIFIVAVIKIIKYFF